MSPSSVGPDKRSKLKRHSFRSLTVSWRSRNVRNIRSLHFARYPCSTRVGSTCTCTDTKPDGSRDEESAKPMSNGSTSSRIPASARSTFFNSFANETAPVSPEIRRCFNAGYASSEPNWKRPCGLRLPRRWRPRNIGMLLAQG